jgi:hypothetical protein
VNPHRSAGQASAEYVAVLLLIGTLLAGAGTAVAVDGVGERVTTAVRTALCVVGGGLCRTADAAAAGLPPCVTRERSEREGTSVDIALLRIGEHGEWRLALRSDGGAIVTRLEEREAGGTAGVGVTFSPAGLDAHARATVTAGYRGGGAWSFADAAEAARWLAATRRAGHVVDGRRPDVRWDALTARSDASVGLAIAELASAGLQAGADGALGLRREGDRRTLTLEVATDASALHLDLLDASLTLHDPGSLVADVTWERGTVRELALRVGSARDGRLEEIAARLDLRDPVSRALAERLLRPGGDPRDELAALARRIRTHGVVERSGYSTTEERSGLSIAGRLGVSLGLSHEEVTAERRLTDAVAWVRGGPAQRRFDCLGV